jgi:hypothetical protein
LTAEHITLILSIFSILANGIIVLLLERSKRATNRQLADMEQRRLDADAARENATRDDQNLSTTLMLTSTLASTMANTLQPLKTSFEKMLQLSEQLLEQSTRNFEAFLARADAMHAVVERRDQEAAADRQAHQERHEELLARLDQQHRQIEALTKKVGVCDLPTDVRGDITRLVLLATTIGDDVKQLLHGAQEPGEAAPQHQESKDAEK